MKEQINQLSAYEPGLSPRGLKEKYGVEGELHKLASNENLYGPSPKVKEAITQHLDELFYYPETGSPTLREHRCGSHLIRRWFRRSNSHDFSCCLNARR